MAAGGHPFGAQGHSGTDFTLPLRVPLRPKAASPLAAEREMAPDLAGCRIATSTGLVNLNIGHLPTIAPATSTTKCELRAASCMQGALVLQWIVREKREMSSRHPARQRIPFRMRRQPLPEDGNSCELDR